MRWELGQFARGWPRSLFQTVANNRIITPSLLGFEALHSLIQTGLLFFGGLPVLLAFSGNGAFLLQVGLMIGLSLVLYSRLLSGARQNLQLLLLVGIVLGTALRSLSTFMRRLLDPAEFDILQARLFGSVNNADPESFPIAIVLVVAAIGWLLSSSNCMNTMRLKPAIAIILGIKYRYCVIKILVIVAILMSVSTALLGPITFLGFLAASLSYQIVPTFDHRYQFPVVILLSYCILTGAYFMMYHVFNAQGVVSLIIELVGGLTFLALLMKRGKT
ncbi:iron chelate uptake ABC transporter family permease subunit [Fundicoccus sp. Sow4_D5]|uniref:iron chelate uptake ABC transporter family permease subunit n=1 Tax=Fundicoccus sp. Sow4_D5 TaxID=3438782 RepID=UPI003F921C02